MATVDLPARLTYEDYLTLPPDGFRHEIIDGEHVMSPAPLLRHQRIVMNLAALLHAHALHTHQGTVLVAPTDVRLEGGVVQPDVLFVRAERAFILEREAVHGAPDLVVEVLSEATRRSDELQKRRLYERTGVQEYWIADPETDRLRVYRRGPDGAYGPSDERAAEFGHTVETALLPGLTLTLADVFAP